MACAITASYSHGKKERGLLQKEVTKWIAMTADPPQAQRFHLTRPMIYELDQPNIEAIADPVYEGPSNEQLMALIKNGDDAALEMLYRRHTRLLRTVVARVLNNEHDIDDTIQEIFLEVWRQAERYDEGKGKALGWIVTLARRRAIDKLRKKMSYGRAEERFRVETEGAFGVGTPIHAVNDAVTASETSVVFKRLLDALPAPQRQALSMTFYGGLSQRQIATETGIPLGTIKTRIELAIRKLRQSISAIGGSAEWGFAEAC